MSKKTTPRFREIYNELKEALLSKAYQGKAMLPSENSLCQEFETSRQTIRSALKLFDEDGLVYNLPGKGWQILRNGNKRPPSTKHIGHVLFLGRNDQASSLQYKGINEYASDHGLSTEFIPLNLIGQDRRDIDLNKLNTKDCEGIIYFNDNQAPQNLLHFIVESKKPLVQLGHYGYSNFDTVCGDYYAGLQTLVHHLHSLGYKNIAFTGQKTLHTSSPVFKERLRGYRQACEDLQLPDKSLLADWGHFLQPHADKELVEWLMKDGSPACFIGSGAHDFNQICSILNRHHIKIPGQVGLCLIGDPNIEETRSFYPAGRVTMLIEPWEELGHICIQRIAERINGDISPPHLSLVPLPVSNGDSTESDFLL